MTENLKTGLTRSNDKSASGPNRKGIVVRCLFWSFLGFGLMGGVWSTPQLAVSPVFSERFTNYVFQSWKTPVQVQSYQLGWNSPLALHGITADYQDVRVIEIKEAVTELPFGRFFTETSDYGTVTIDELTANIQMFGSVSNIELVSAVDENMIMDIVVQRADITMSDEKGFQWARLEDIPLAIRITESERGQRTTIDPQLLIDHGPIQLERNRYVPEEFRDAIKEDYVEAIVSLELLEYEKLTRFPEETKYRFRLTIHEVKLKNRLLASMINMGLKPSSREPVPGEKQTSAGTFLVLYEHGEEKIVRE